MDEQEKAFKENVPNGKSSTITFKAWYSLAILFTTCIVLFIINIIYSNHVADQSYQRSQVALNQAQEQNHKICSIFVVLDKVYKATPPTTPTGRTFASAINNLVVAYDCKED